MCCKAPRCSHNRKLVALVFPIENFHAGTQVLHGSGRRWCCRRQHRHRTAANHCPQPLPRDMPSLSAPPPMQALRHNHQ